MFPIVSLTITLFLLLLAAPIAEAHEAWFLWSRSYFTKMVLQKDGAPAFEVTEKWHFQSAYPDFERCQDAAAEALRQAAERGRDFKYGSTTRDGEFLDTHLTNGESFRMSWRCIPASIDPRTRAAA